MEYPLSRVLQIMVGRGQKEAAVTKKDHTASMRSEIREAGSCSHGRYQRRYILSSLYQSELTALIYAITVRCFVAGGAVQK